MGRNQGFFPKPTGSERDEHCLGSGTGKSCFSGCVHLAPGQLYMDILDFSYLYTILLHLAVKFFTRAIMIKYLLECCAILCYCLAFLTYCRTNERQKKELKN